MKHLRVDYQQWPHEEGDICFFLLTDEEKIKSGVSVPYNSVSGTVRELTEQLGLQDQSLSVECYAQDQDITVEYRNEWYPVTRPSSFEKHLVHKLLEPWTDSFVR